MPDISSSLSKREVNARQNTYTKSEIDLKDGAIQAIAEAAQTTADAAEKKNQEQDQLIAELQKSSHTHSNKAVLDKTEQPYTTAERDKLAGLENYTHPTYTAHAKGFYKFASDGEGHVTDAEKVTKEDITCLGIPDNEKLDGKQDKLTAGDNVTIQGNTISSKNTRYEFGIDGTGLEINQSTSSEFYRLNFPSTRSITSLIPYFLNSYDDGRGFCWCQLAFAVLECDAHGYKKIGIEGGFELGTNIYYEPQGVAKIAIALYGDSDRRGVSITADLPLHNGKLFEVRPLENLSVFSSAPEKKLSVYAVGRYDSLSAPGLGRNKYAVYLFLYSDKRYTATEPGVKITVETSVYPFSGNCAEVNRNYSNVIQLDSSAISESIRMSAEKVEAVTDILANKADKSEIPDTSGKQDRLTAGANITINGSIISAKDTTYTAGANITIKNNTISAKDTTYTSKSAVNGGTDVSLVTTGEKAIWNAKTSNVGTITGIKMNGASKGTSGVVDLGTVITAHQDISGKQDKSTAVTHTANTAVGSATKPVYVAANGVAIAISHAINADVPANAKFTDTVYTHPTTSGNKHIPAGGSSGQILRWSADGTAVWGADAFSTGHMTYGYAENSTAAANSGYTWARVAYCETAVGYDTITMTLLVTSGYAGAGLFSVFYRNSSTGKACDTIGFEQIFTNKPTKIANDYFKFIAVYTDSGVRYEIWYNIQTRWSSAQFTCLAEQAYAGVSTNKWKFEKRNGNTFVTAPPIGNKEATYYNNGVVNTATTLTDSGWTAMTVEGYAKSGTVKYRTYGKQITITGSVVLAKDIATSYPAPQNIASTTLDFSKIVGCSGVGRSSGVGAYVTTENYGGENLVCVNALGNKIAAGSTLNFTITGFID